MKSGFRGALDGLTPARISRSLVTILVGTFLIPIASLSLPALLPSANAAQLTWTAPASTPSASWHALAMSADGTKIVGAVYGGHIWTSNDSGATWSDRSGPGNQNWLAVAVTESNNIIYGAFTTGSNSGGVYKSTDFGANWTLTSAPTNCSYIGVATTGTTNVSVACTGTGGGIYSNTAAGVGASNTWTLSSGTSGLGWTDLRSSSNGTKLIASAWAGGIYVASDNTFTYVNKVSSPLTSYLWSGVGINSDGTKLVAVNRGAPNFGTGGNVYTSTDSGATWVASSGANGANGGQSNGDWMAAAINSDGTTIAAVAFGSPSRIALSQDSGATWVYQTGTTTLNFINVAVSSNGRRLVATAYGEKLYQATYTPVPTATSLSVTTGSVAGGTSSTLTGTGLSQVSGITIDGNAATGINVLSDTSVSFRTPAGTNGAKNVTVTTPGGSATLTNGFTYYTPPSVTCYDSNGNLQTIYTGTDGVVVSYSLASCTGAVSFGAGITRVQAGAFLTSAQYVNVNSPTYPATYNTKVTKVTFASTGFTTLDDRSFANLSSLSYIAFPNTVRSIVDNVFWRSSIQTMDFSAYAGNFTGFSMSGAAFNYATPPEFVRDCSPTNTVPTSDYLITFMKSQRSGQTFYCTPSTTNTLSGLTPSSGTLQPSFNSGTTSYTLTVPNNIDSMTVVATSTQSSSSIYINGIQQANGGDNPYSQPSTVKNLVSLTVGLNNVPVVVRAQDSVSTQNYIITVTRSLPAQATLTASESTTSATYSGNAYSAVPVFSASGGSGSGQVTFSVANGTATGCTLSNSSASATLTAATSGTCLITATKPGLGIYDDANSAPISFTFIRGKLDPTFDTATSTSGGFTLQIKNWNDLFTWTGTSSVGGTVSFSSSGLISVTGVNPGTSSTVTIVTNRTGFDSGTATSLAIKSINGTAKTPTFSAETGTATGFQLQISNFDSAYNWTSTSSVGGTVQFSSSGLITVTGVNPGTASTVTIQTTRTGYDTGTATSASYASINGTAKIPSFSTETGTATGFQLQISNFDSAYNWTGTSSVGGTVSVSGVGLITVTGVNPGTPSTVTIRTTRSGYDTGTATSASYASITGTARTPSFGAPTQTADGFTLPITNFDANFSWTATNSLGKTVTVNGTTGLITVTGVNPGTASTVTIRTTRTGYDTGTATSSSISSLTGAAKVPTFGTPTSTVDGFTLPITNYETTTTWSITNSLVSTVRIETATGLIRVTGIASGTFSTVTVRTTRLGYETGTATSASISSATAATQPTDVSATTAARSAVVSWTAPSDTGGIAITDYAVEYSSTNGDTWTAFSHSPSALTNLTVTGLLDGTSYLYRVAAINAAGQSPFSTSSAVITSYYVVCTTGSFWVAGSTIPSAAGKDCTGTATIPQGIIGVAINAFAPGSGASATNRSLTNIVFPASGFANIDQGGFRNLGLTTLTIPASVTMVGLAAFENNPLTAVTITGASGGASTYLSQSAFNNQDVLFGLSTSIALTFGSGKIDIGFNFGSSTRFSTVDFGTGLNSIDETAFKQNGISPGWIPLFPSTIKTIGKDAFTYNPNITTIRFGSSITSSITAIDNAAFDAAYVKSVQYCGPTGTVLSNYLKNRLALAKIWCNYLVPNAPTISTSSQTNQQVTIGWTKGASRDEAPTDTFTVQYKSGGGSWISVAYDSSTPLSSTIRNLTNGTTYSFRVAANNIVGSSTFSNEVQVTPLGLATIPTFDTSVATANGFTFNVTNYDSRTAWSASVTAGSASVSLGSPSGSRLPITVTSMNDGATASIQVTTTRSTYDTGTASTAGTSLNGALTPTFGTPTVTTNGFTAAITNYDSNFTWAVSTSTGSASIVSGSLVVSGASFATTVIETVTATRSNFVTGRSNLSVTTLAGLTATYYGNGNTGGLAPSDTSTYQTNGTLVLLGNSGSLTKPGYTFTGWNLNSNNSGTTYVSGNSFTLANTGVSFYAQWTATPYNVIYHATEAGSGTAPTEPNQYTIGTTANIRGNSGNLLRTGYVFAGWADNANRTGKIYISGDTYTVQTNDIDLWAAWTPNTYTITYNVNGATGSPSKSSDSYTVGSNVVSLATIGSMAKTGYNFGGWATQSVGTAISDSFTVAANTTLFAQWTIASFTLTYNLDGGTGSVPAPTAVNYLQQFNLAPATGLTKVDTNTVTYAFVAWSLNSVTYNAGQGYYMPASDLTFTATWTRIYNVTYSLNGGSSATAIPDDQRVSGDTITVSTVTPLRTGYDFMGWVDQSGRSAVAGADYVVSDGHYLIYAQWSATPYSVTYDAAGGSPAPTESSKTIGQSFTVGAAPSKIGYDFKGWNDGTNTYAAGAPYVSQSSNIVFTAQWQAQVYTIKYDLNGGSGSAGGDRAYTYGTAAYTLPTTGFSLTDYSFGGWATAPGGPSIGATFAPSSSISLYAIWNIAIYRLNFDAQSGVSESSTAKVSMGQALILPRATRANYNLQGWSSQPSGGSITAGGSSFTPTSDATLYAQWALQVFTVTYNGNGGTSDTSTASMTYGSTTPLVLPSATRNHYFFDGWYSAATGGYLIGSAGASYSPSGSVTIYAHWTQASLQGLGQATKIAEVTVLAGNNSSFTAGSQGSSATVAYTADSLPSGTVITAYVQNSTERASSLIDPNLNYILSMVVAWVAPDGTVPDTAPGKPILVTISNTGITKGSRVYGLVGTTPKFLGVATQDGSVQVSLTQDPTVTVAITRPDSATAVTAVSIDDTSAFITWEAPAVTGGSPITNYTVTSSAGQICSTVSTSCTVTGLSPATDYTFTVVARNALGSSDQSLPSALITTFGTPAPPAPPAPPVNSTNSVVMPIAIVQAPAKDVTPAPAPPAPAAPEVKPIPTEDPNQSGKSDADKAAENAQKLALEDAAKAAAAIAPAITVYSISKDLKLSDYNLAYLRAYLATLKPHAMVTCIGYTYTVTMSQAEATALAKKQANALCAIIKSERATLSTSILISPSESAPVAAPGAQWVAVSYRVDSYEPITPTKRYQTIQNGLSFLAYQPSYVAALELKKIEIRQCSTNKNYGMSAQYGSGKKSIVITEYSATKSCSLMMAIPNNAKRTIVTKNGTSMRPGARISIVTAGLTAIEIKKLVAGLARVPIQ